MGQTPVHSLPYPELNEPADVPLDIKQLAEAVDALIPTVPVIPPGGGGFINIPVLDVGMSGQNRAGRQLAVADFTNLGLAAPIGLWNLGSLADASGNNHPLTDKGSVPYGVGINGQPTTAAVFAGSTGQALWIVDGGANDPLRIKTGSFGCWLRTAKRATTQAALSKWGAAALGKAWWLAVVSNVAYVNLSTDGSAAFPFQGISDIADDRWHHVVCTHDGTTVRLYVDGVLETTGAFAAPIFGGSAPMNIGADSADGTTAATNPFYGRVDEAFVTADVFTDDQVRLLYCAKLAHALGAIPGDVRIAVHRLRKGAPLLTTDFPSAPVRLHNFTAGALTDAGSGNVPLVANPGTGAIVDVAGADGTLGAAKSFSGAHQGLSATDAGLPGGLNPVSMGAWFKTTNSGTTIFLSYGTITTGERTLYIDTGAGGTFRFIDGPNNIAGPVACDGQWHFGVVVVDNTAGDGVKAKLYMDGRLVGGTTALAAVTLAGAGHFRVGVRCDGASGPFSGQVDTAFVHPAALTAAEIAALYAKGNQDLAASTKNAGDHVERVDGNSILLTFDTLQSQMTVDLGVAA